jgi:hypothetical protein
MVNVTLDAKQELLRRKVSEISGSQNLTLRIVPGGTGEPVLVPDIRRIGDEVVEHLGTPVLLLARDVVRMLDHSVIDCRADAQGARLVFTGNERPEGPPNDRHTMEEPGISRDGRELAHAGLRHAGAR